MPASARYDAAVPQGGLGASAQRLGELVAALKAALDSPLPACINVQMEGHPAPLFARNQVGASAH
ncbi:hypothetical protein ACIP1U_14825 [Cupriavidus sp. NPDC089707]|uniref:hypothetical protein n=1 Tax=Cupriavidus sp. NPDC089707 TaxID=3363963 RepID=UPI003828CC3F